MKKKYEIEHAVNWQQDRCCLWPFPLETRSTSYNVNEKLMTWSDFIIFKEHKFLRNIFSSDELSKTNNLKDFKTFHEKFVGFLKIVVFLQSVFHTSEDLDDCFYDDLLDFCKNCCADSFDFNGIKDLITNVKIKNKRNGSKIPKFTLQT